MKHNYEGNLALVPKQSRKKSYDPMRSIRKGIREEARFIDVVAYTALGAGMGVGGVIMGILDNYLEDFIEGMEAAGSVNIGIPSTVSAFIITLCGIGMFVFGIAAFIFLKASANELRKLAGKLKEEGGK